jgi:hypothetical protein
MAWEWSHTEDAYEAVHQQLQDKADSAADGDREAQEWLLTVWAEWNAEDWRDWRSCDRFDPRAYGKALRAAHKLTRRNVDGWHQLAEDIWENSQTLRFCTNGGWEAYVCPSGCGCHLIPFSPE